MSNLINRVALGQLRHALAPLHTYLVDKRVTEVMINGPSNIFVERDGEVSRVDIQFEDSALSSLIKSAGKVVGQDVDDNSIRAIVNAEVSYEGTELRMAAVHGPYIPIDGHTICIRRHSDNLIPLERFDFRSREIKRRVSENVGRVDDYRSWLRARVRDRASIMMVGGTGAGKTSVLNALVAEIPSCERVITIEDTKEMKVNNDNRVRLRSFEHAGVTTRELVRLSLRLRPDRILLGEVRGPEAFDLLQALNTGHDGGMATIHASSALDGLSRLEALVMQGLPSGGSWPLRSIQASIAQAIDIIVVISAEHTSAGRRDRYISEIIQVRKLNPNGEGYEYERVL